MFKIGGEMAEKINLKLATPLKRGKYFMHWICHIFLGGLRT